MQQTFRRSPLDRATHLAIAQYLWTKNDRSVNRRLFAVIDAARNAAIYAALKGTKTAYHCLYRGAIPTSLAQAAPYVVELSGDSAFLDFVVRNGWGDSWGLFIVSDSTLDEVHRHLRRFLRVQDESGKHLIFRYYDPRVMRAFLPTCDPEQLEALFDGIEQFIFEEAEPNGASEYRLIDRQLVHTSKRW